MGETLSTLTGGSNGGGSDAGGGSADAGSTRATQEAPAAAASSSASHASHASGVALTRAEVSRHATTDDAWVVIDSNVYNITPLLDDHPGGPEVLLEQIGSDGSDAFEGAGHSQGAHERLKDFLLGPLVTEAAKAAPTDGDAASSPSSATTPAPPALNPQTSIPLKLIEREDISHDTRRLRFALPEPDQVLGLPVGQHVYVSARIRTPGQDEPRLIMRPYTPVSPADTRGYVELVIKTYPPSEPKFPHGGKLSQHLDRLHIGDTADFKGPTGKIVYKGHGKFSVSKTAKDVERRVGKQLAMIAAGTGITPMFQLIQAVLSNPEDSTNITLLFCNKTEGDILLRAQLDRLAAEHTNFNVTYVLTRPGPGWTGRTGRINAALLKEVLPAPSDDVQVLMCGPSAMIKEACLPSLQQLGYPEDHQLVY